MESARRSLQVKRWLNPQAAGRVRLQDPEWQATQEEQGRALEALGRATCENDVRAAEVLLDAAFMGQARTYPFEPDDAAPGLQSSSGSDTSSDVAVSPPPRHIRYVDDTVMGRALFDPYARASPPFVSLAPDPETDDSMPGLEDPGAGSITPGREDFVWPELSNAYASTQWHENVANRGGAPRELAWFDKLVAEHRDRHYIPSQGSGYRNSNEVPSSGGQTRQGRRYTIGDCMDMVGMATAQHARQEQEHSQASQGLQHPHTQLWRDRDMQLRTARERDEKRGIIGLAVVMQSAQREVARERLYAARLILGPTDFGAACPMVDLRMIVVGYVGDFQESERVLAFLREWGRPRQFYDAGLIKIQLPVMGNAEHRYQISQGKVNDPENDRQRCQTRKYTYYSCSSIVDERKAAAELDRIMEARYVKSLGGPNYFLGRGRPDSDGLSSEDSKLDMEGSVGHANYLSSLVIGHMHSGVTGSYLGVPVARVVSKSKQATATNRGKKKNKKNRQPKQKYRVRNRK
jgi:hypothetical protein